MTKIVWALIDNRAGSATQARGVAKELGFEAVEKSIGYNKLAKLPNLLKGAGLLGIKKESQKNLTAPYPDLVISASRRTAPVARWIKKKSGGKTKIVQIMHPGNAGLADFDLVFIPEHDKNKKILSNTRFIVGSPHGFTPERLKLAKEKWREAFALLEKPLTAVMVGGSSGRRQVFTVELAQQFGKELKKLKTEIGGSILITTSKRTGVEMQKAILKEIDGIPLFKFLWGSKEENPYQGFLACADQIVVTGDSVSMCSEACGTGKPVYVFTGKNWVSKKMQRFVQTLYDNRYAADLSVVGKADFKPKKRLNPMEDIVREIKALF